MLPGPAEPKLIVGFFFCGRDQFLHIGGRKGGTCVGHDGRSRQQTDRLEVLERLVRHADVQSRIRRVIAHDDDEGVTVGIRFRRRLRSNHGAGAGPALDDHRLSPIFRQFLPDHARQDVDRSAGCERHNDLDRLLRILVRRRLRERAGAENGRSHGEGQRARDASAPCDRTSSHVPLLRMAVPFRPGERSRHSALIAP
jgi:hypothetical protein